MKINGKQVKTYKNEKENIKGIFAYDGCHKIYICETKKDCIDALANGYRLIEISLLEEVYNLSCDLKFINNWKLNKVYVPQCEDAVFEYDIADEKSEEKYLVRIDCLTDDDNEFEECETRETEFNNYDKALEYYKQYENKLLFCGQLINKRNNEIIYEFVNDFDD